MGFTSFGDTNYNKTIDQSVIDNNGLLFLPAAGFRNGAGIDYVGSYGYYWSSTAGSATNAYNLGFSSGYFNPQDSCNRYLGFSVRLVQGN